ncbi:MAG: PAC2 family protein [Phycisphaerae bacterium]|nr:PAC2 family protein [Phycisphaerae bacterium]
MRVPIHLPRPWLVAAWPGMGDVATTAANHLIDGFAMIPIERMSPGARHDVSSVRIRGGLIDPVRLPQSVFFRAEQSSGRRDIIVFLSQAQPMQAAVGYAHEVLDVAERLDVERVVTFASLASRLLPPENPRVWGAATDSASLAELRRAEVPSIDDGEIGGLNGLLLGVAASRGIGGMCLLAEIPDFAPAVPNPKAARAALSVFSVLAGIDINLHPLNRREAVTDRILRDILQQIALRESHDDTLDPFSRKGAKRTSRASDGETGRGGDSRRKKKRKANDSAAAQQIEALFIEAKKDQSQAVHLKSELDRLGLFARYEGRFLDLFRRAE